MPDEQRTDVDCTNEGGNEGAMPRGCSVNGTAAAADAALAKLAADASPTPAATPLPPAVASVGAAAIATRKRRIRKGGIYH